MIKITMFDSNYESPNLDLLTNEVIILKDTRKWYQKLIDWVHKRGLRDEN